MKTPAAELSSAEAAYQTARRKEIYEALHPETRAESFKGNRHTGSLAGDNLSFTSETAKVTGKDRRTIERDAARVKLGEALKDISGMSLDSGVELDALVKLAPDQRADVIEDKQKAARSSQPASMSPQAHPAWTAT